MNSTTTPETDTALKAFGLIEHDRGLSTYCAPAFGWQGLAEFARRLERERDCAREDAMRNYNAGMENGRVWSELAKERERERDEARHELAVAKNWAEHHGAHVDELIAENVALRGGTNVDITMSDGLLYVGVRGCKPLGISTNGGQSYIDGIEFDDYGISLDPAVSISGLTGSEMAALLCVMHDHLYLNGWRFAIERVSPPEQDQRERLVITHPRPHNDAE